MDLQNFKTSFHTVLGEHFFVPNSVLGTPRGLNQFPNEVGFEKIEKMIEGVFLSFSENAFLDCANRQKIILDHLSVERAEITRRAALGGGSRGRGCR